MDNYFLSGFPWVDELKKRLDGISFPPYREVNAHIHTPFSFSAFERLENIFQMAGEENIPVLGINDFLVTDGYESFSHGCLMHNIFPLFNIEFIGLLKKEQKDGIRINDPNNPGRIYFSGKGLDYPFNPGLMQRLQIQRVIRESQFQIKEMISRLNYLIHPINPSLVLTYQSVRENFAENLVRERHLAKAVRHLATSNYESPDKQLEFIEALYGGKKSKAGMENPSVLENEIRSNLLKSGGAAFVQEDKDSFPELSQIINLIIKAGGIPCYPVLLDDLSGKYTEYEADAEKLHVSLSSLDIGCIELIPGRNDLLKIRSFVEFFDDKGYVILFGTEHNTPEMAPLTVSARGAVPLDEYLKKISWEGACVIAAHQYLRAHRRQGFVLSDGTISIDQKNELSVLGQMVIEYFLIRKKYESES
jgi:hypothetical protein